MTGLRIAGPSRFEALDVKALERRIDVNPRIPDTQASIAELNACPGTADNTPVNA